MTVEERIGLLGEMFQSMGTAALTVYTPGFEVISSTDPQVDILNLIFSYTTGAYTKEHAVDNLEKETEAKKRNSNERFSPMIRMNKLGLAWLSDVLFQDGKVEHIYVLGPVFLDDFSVQHIMEELERLKLSVRLKHIFLDYISRFPVITLNRLHEYGAMLRYCIYQEKIPAGGFSYLQGEDEQENRQYQEFFTKKRHGTYAMEQEIMKHVEEGNLGYEKVWSRYSFPEVGNFGGGKLLREQKNIVIMFTTLCSRAAIRGGLAAETALSLCDGYILKTEGAESLSQLTKVKSEMFHEFVLRVSRVKSGESAVSPQIRKACDYISLHLDEKLEIHMLAQLAGYSDYYFSNKFKQETGKSVRDYIMEQKIGRAKSLLQDTVLPVQEISEQLGFGTQSYFGEVFRRLTGCTPGEYRNQR